MNLGELIVELSADSSELEKTLERAKKKAYEAAVAVEKSFENINLNVGVDDDSLVDLNKHLNLKVQHLKEVNKYFNNNPIVVSVDDKELTDLNKHLNLKVQHLKEVNKYFDNNPIKVNTDTKSLDELEERLGGLSNRTITITVESDLSKQLEKSLADAVKNAVKEEMSEQASATAQQQTAKEASSPNKVQKVDMVVNPGRAIMDGIFGGLGKGFTDGINRGIEDAVGVDIPTMTRITSNMFLRYFGVGKKAQSDPKNEQKRVEAILKDGVDTFIKVHDANTKKSNVTPQSSTITQKTVVTNQPVTTLTAPSVIKSAPQQKTTAATLPTAIASPVTTAPTTSPITVVTTPRKTTTVVSSVSTANRVGKKQRNLGLDDDLGVDFEAAGGSAARGLLRFFGIGKKAQSDPKEEKARIEAIIKGMVDDYSQLQSFQAPAIVTNTLSGISNTFLLSIDETLEGLGQQSKVAISKAVRKSSQGVLNKASTQVQKAANALFNEIEGRGGESFTQVVGKQLATAAKSATNNLLKTILPNTYSVAKKFISTGGNISPIGSNSSNVGNSEAKSPSVSSSSVASSVPSIKYTQPLQNSSFDALGQASLNLSSAAQSLNEFALQSKITNVQSPNLNSTVEQVKTELQTALDIPVNIPKKPQPELELLPVETTASQVPQQLKQHFEAIKTNTLKNIDLSKQYAEATARENGEELVPLQIGKPKKSDEIKLQKEISLKGVSDSFTGINQYFNAEYKKLKSEFDIVKLTGTSAEIKATKEKIKIFIDNTKLAVADIDAIAKQAQDAGFDKTINSDLSKVHAGGKSQLKSRQTNAKELLGKLNTEEKNIFDKQLTHYAPLAQQLGIDIDAGLAKGVKHGSDGVSDVARQMLDDLIETVEAKMKIQSPSWVMFEIGMMIASGLFFGMQKGNSKVSEGARKMVTTVKSAFDPLNDLSSLGLAGTYMIPNLSDISNKAMIAMSATSTGLNMLDKVGEHHAANPDQTLFQATYGTAKNFVKDAVTDKTFTQPREAVDHLVNIAKFGTELVTPLGLKAFTNPIGSANDGVAAAFRTMAIAKSLKQAHQDTKQQTQQDSTLNYASTFKNVLPQYLKANKIGRAEALKMFGGGLKVVPDMHGSNDANLYNAGAVAMGTAASLGNAAISKFAPVANFVQTGKDIVKGLEQGILKNAGIATNAIAGLGNSIQSQIKQNMGIQSPSKVMIALGLMISSGLAIGISSGAVNVSGSMKSVIANINSGVEKYKNIKQFLSQGLDKNATNIISQTIQSLQKDFGENSFIGVELDKVEKTLKGSISKINDLLLSTPIGKNLNKLFNNIEQKITEFNQKLTSKIKNIFEQSNNFKEVGTGFMSVIGQGITSSVDKLKIKVFDTFETFFSSMMSPFIDIIAKSDNFSDFGINLFSSIGQNIINSFSKIQNLIIGSGAKIKDVYKNVLLSVQSAILTSNNFKEFAVNLFSPIGKSIANLNGNLLKTIATIGKNILTSAKNIFKNFLPDVNNVPNLKLNSTSDSDMATNQQPLEAPKLTTDLLPGQLTGNNYNKLANLVLQLTGKTASQRQIPLLEKETDPSMAGMAGAYYRGDNKIRIHAKDYEALISSDVSKLSDDLIDTILHEMFHAIQYDFGKIKTVQEASMFSPSPTLKEMAKWSSVSEFSADRRRGKYSPEVVSATFDLELGAYSFGSRYTQQAKEALKTNTSLSQSVSGSPNQVAKEVQQLQQAALKIGKSHYNALEKLQKMNLSDEAYNKYHSMANIVRDKGISFAESLDSVESLSPEEVQQAIEKFNKIVDYINNIPETVNQKPFEINHERQKSKSTPVAKVVQSSSLEQSKLPKELQQTILSFKQTYQDISGQIKTMNLPDDIYSQAHKAIEKGHNKGTELIEVLNNIQDLSPEQANSAMEKFNQYSAYLSNIPTTINKLISKPDEVVAQQQKAPVTPRASQSIQQSEFFRNIRQVVSGSANLKELATNIISAIVQNILSSIRKYALSFIAKVTTGFTDVTDQPIEAFKQNLPQQAGQALTNTYRTISPILPTQFQAVDIESRKWETEFNKKLKLNQSQNKFNQYIPSIPVKSTEVLTNVHRAVSPILPIQFQANDFDFHKQLNSGNSNLLNNPAVNQVVNTAKKLKSTTSFKEIGSNLISSLGQGFLSVSSGVLGIVTAFAKGILSAVKKVFRIASPSGEGIDTGENLAGSMGIGINNQAQTAVNAAKNMAEDIKNAIADPWDTPLPMNLVFKQDLDLESQAQAHIKATKEHFQKLKIQDLLSDIGVNFGADFGHEGIASNVLSSSDLLGYLSNKSASLTPLQSTVYNRLVDDFQEQRTLAAHHFAIARADGNSVDPAVLRGLDAGFNSILLRIVEFSKRLGIKGQSIDKLLASNQSVVNTAAYQPPRFVAPKTPIPERQPGQTDQEYSQAVKRALAEDNNNYRKARNAYNRMILGVSNTPTPRRTQLPALPPVPVYVREIIEPVTNVPPVQRTQTTIPPIPDPWNDSVQQLVNTVRQTTRTQFLLPPARERLNINSFVQTQSNLQRLAKEIVAQQPMTQLSRPQPPTIQRTIPPIPDPWNDSVKQLVNTVRQTTRTQFLLPPARERLNINSFVQTQSNLQRLAKEIIAQQPMTQLSRPQPPTIQRTSPIILPRNFVPNPNAQILSSKNFVLNPNAQIISSQKFTPNPNAQIVSSQKFTPKPDAQLILPVVQGLSPAIRSTHSLAQNSISALIAANKQIQATIAGNKVTVSSRFAPIPDPWATPPLSTPPLSTQTVKQLSNQMAGQYGPIPDSWLTSPRSTQAFKQVGKLLIGQIPATLSSTVPSLIPQPAGTTAPKYVFPPQTLGSTVPAYTFPVNPTPKPPIAPVPPIPPTLLDQYLNLGTDLVTNIFNAVSASIRQSTLSGYASLGQVMRNAVNAALFSLADTLKQPLHQALLSQTRSILPWFLKFIPHSFQLLPKLSFAIPFVGGMVLRFGNSIVKNLLENNILKEGGFLTNLLSSIIRVDLSALSGTKTAGVTGFLNNIVSPAPLLLGSQFNPLLALGISSASPFYDAFSGILGLDKSVKPNPKKQAPTIEQVLQNQTKINREKALLRDVKEVGTSTNISTGVGQNLTAYPDAQRTKAEESLKRAVESGKAIPKLDELTRKALRERGVSSLVRNQMDSAELLAERENILKNPLNATSKERDFLLYTADIKKLNVATIKGQEKRIISILKERGKSDQDIENIRNSGTDGLFDVGDDLIKNLPTITKQPTATQTVQPRTSSASIASKELVENLGNTLLNSVLNNLDVPVIPKSVIQRMIGKKLGERSATIADAINAFGIEKSKAEQVLTRNLESGNTKRLDGLTKQILRERGVTKSVRDAMTPEQLAAARDNVLNNPLDITKKERDFLRFEGDLEANIGKKGFDITQRTREAKLIRILRERGVSNAEIKNIRQSNGLNDLAADLVANPRTSTKGFMGKLTEAYASNDQDAMKELVKQGLRKTGMSAKQIDAIDPKLLDTATAGLMTTLSGLQAKFREKGFDMGKALAKGLKDSMVNLANAKDDLEYNAKKVMGQANFGDSVGLIFRRMFRGTAATQGQFAEMYNQMGAGVKKAMFGGSKEGDEMFPNVLQFMGSITTTLAPITTMIGAITPLLLPLAPIITGIGMAVNMVAPHVAKLIDGIQRVEVLQRRFKFLGGSKEGGIAEFKYAKDIANKLNVPSEVAANSYSQLAIAAKDSKMEGQGVKELFEGITSSLSALGINGQDASLVFMAYTQILAKGKLSMEELRQQLGEKFPPAMATFARAMGVTVPEMNELVASGGILSQDILPKVAKVLKEDYGSAASDQAGGLVVALNKLGNVGFEITTIFTDKLGGTLAFFVNTFANILGVLSGALKELIPLVKSFMIGFAATISIGLTIILSKFGPFVVAMKSLQAFLLATFSAITTNMMPMVIGIVSDVADGWLGAEKNLIDNMFQGINNMIVVVFSTIDTAMRSMSDNKVSFSTVFGGLIQGAEQAGSIIDWLKGVFAGFFKILPSGIVEILAIVFMLEQGTGLLVMALWPAIKGLWGGITGIFGATAKAFYGVMGSLKAVVELMMTSSAVASNATNNVAKSGVRSMAIVQGALGFLSKALLHFGLAYAVLMFSKGDFSDPLRESINKSTADINKHLNQVRLNINQTTEAFNKATKSVEKLGNTITYALPAKGVQLDVRSLWGGGDWKWDDAVRETNAKYRQGGSGLSAMDVIGTGALYAGGAGYAAAAGSKAIKAITDLAVKIAPIIQQNKALVAQGIQATSITRVTLLGRLATAIAPVVAIMGPWGLAIAGLIATIVAVGAALDAFAPKITEAQLNNTEEKGGLPEEIKQIINAKKAGERLDSASLQVIKLYKDQQLSNERLKEFMASIGLDGKNPYSFVARPVVPMTGEQKQEFESEIPVQNITKSIEDKKASLQELEKNAGTTETEKSKARSKQGYKTVQEELTKLEKDKLLMQLSFMANYDNKLRMDAIDNKIKYKEKEIADSYKDSRNFDYTTDGFGGASEGRNIKADELTKELEKLQKEKAALQININASAKRRVNYDAIKKIDVDMQKTAAEFVEASNQLAVNPNDKLRNKAGLAKERIAQLQKQRQKLVDEFGDPTPAIKQILEVTKREIEKTLSDSSITSQQRKVTVQQLRETQETLEKSLAEAEKFSIAPIADTMYTQAIAALKDNEVKSNVDISKNKIVSNQAQARLYGTTLTSQQIAPGLSDRQIADLTFQQKVLERSLKIKEDNLLKLQNAAAQSPTNLSQIQEEITKLQQEIAKDREQVSQNTLEIVKAQREARQALIDQTKQVAEYYRTSLRESQAAAIEFDKATNNIKSQQFATKLKQALVGAGNNIFTNFIDSVIGLFQQLTEIENLRLDRQKQKLDYENNIQDILIKVTEMQRSLPGKIVPFSLDQIRNFDKELGTVNSSVSDINKEVNSVTKNLGVSAVNSTIQLNKQLKEVLSTVEKINKVTSNQQLQPPNNSGVSPVPISQRTKIPVTPEDEQIWREFVAPQSGIKSGTSSLPTSTLVANATKEMLVAGLMSDMGMGYTPYSQVTKPKPKLPDNAFLSPIVGKNLSNIINTKYRSEDSFGKTGGIRFNQNIGVGKNTNIQSSVTGMARLVGNTLEIVKQTKGGTIKLIYEGLNIPSVKKNLKLNDGGLVNINAGQLIGTLAGNNFKFRTEVNSFKMDPLKVIRDIEYKRLNAFQKATRFFDQPNNTVTNLGLLPEPKPVATSSTPSTPPVNRAINWLKTEVKKIVRKNAPEEVKRVIRNTKNFVDNIPPIIPTYNQNTNSYNPGILDILIGNNSKPKPKPNNSTGSSGNNQSTGKKPTTTNQGTGKKQTTTNQGTGKKQTTTNQSNVPNLSGMFPQPSTGGLTTVSNTGNQIPTNLSGAFPQSSGITLTNASTGGNNNQGKKKDKLLVSPIRNKTFDAIVNANDEQVLKGLDPKTILQAPVSGKATAFFDDYTDPKLADLVIQKTIDGKRLTFEFERMDTDSIKRYLPTLKKRGDSVDVKAGDAIGQPSKKSDAYLEIYIDGKRVDNLRFFKDVQRVKENLNIFQRVLRKLVDPLDPNITKLGLNRVDQIPVTTQQPGQTPQIPQPGQTPTNNNTGKLPSSQPGQTPTNNNTGKLPSSQSQVPQIPQTRQPVVIPPGTDPYTRSQLQNQPLNPGKLQPGVGEAGTLSVEAAKKRDAAARLQRQEEISAKLVEFQRNLSNLLRDTNKGIRDESLQAAQDINNASEYIQGLLNPNASDKEKFATDFQKLKNEYQARINEQQNIIESTRAPLAELAKVDELIAAAQREGIDASGLKRLRDEVYRVVKAREQTAIALRNMYTKNKQAVFDKYVSRFKEEQLNKDAEKRANLLGVNISQLKLQLEELKGIQAIDPLNPELLKIPDLEANIADLELTQTTLQKIAALRREWNQSGGKNMGKDVYDKRLREIMDNVTKQTGIIERKRRTDNILAYVNRELGLIDKGAAEREPITKGLQLDNSLFAARNKNGLVNIINFENEALIKQKDLMDSYRKTSLETQRDFKLSSDDRITKRLRNAMNLQKELNVLKVETEYQKAAGEIKNRQVIVDVEVRLSDSAKAIFESKSTIKKNLGLELAGERLDRQNAITTQENEYKRKQNETSQFILDNKLTDSQAYVLRKNNEIENDLKLRTIKSQFSEFAQLIKSFVSGFKSSFKEFLLSTEDTGTALLNLAKGIGKSVLDTLAEMASKRVTDLLFGWMGGTGLNPATELSFAAQQLTQAAYALQNAGNGSIAGASALDMGSFDGFAGFGDIASFIPTGMEFLDPSTFAASDFGTATLTGFAKGGMIDKDTLGKIQNFANGGIVGTMNKERAMTGRTPHLVVASEGERILNHKETAIWNKLQSGISGFADGGIVGGGSGDIASKIGGSTTTVNVPVSVSVNEGSDVDGARLSQTVQALVSDGIRREMRPGGSIRRGNPYGR